MQCVKRIVLLSSLPWLLEIPIYSLERARCLEIQCNPSLCNLAVVFGLIALPGFTRVMSRKNVTQFGHF